MICYEVLFPDLAAGLVRKGARFLINITNDAWFDETSGPFQHVNFGRFRAIETRRFIVRATNTGISTWFDPFGRSPERSPLFQQALLQADVAPSSELTFYVRHQRALPLLLTFLLLVTSLGAFRPNEP
jgi:apolipoprotein N-acyltransferase